MPRIVVDLRYALTIYRYVGERVYSEGGYVLLWDKDQERYIAEHRVVAGRALGRPLRTDEEVHHCNGKRADNSNRNLVVCNPDYHKYLDACMRLRRPGLQLRYKMKQRRTILSFFRSAGMSSSDRRKILKRIEESTSTPRTGSATLRSPGLSRPVKDAQKSKRGNSA